MGSIVHKIAAHRSHRHLACSHITSVDFQRITLGFKFKTNSDTEVVLFSYLAWGNSCVKKFIGMFSFAIYDKTKEKIILFRDRAGVKPLFYYNKDNLFMFSSEIKSFHKIKSFNKDIDIDSVALFFRHGYIDSPFSIYKNVKKLMPGHYIEFCLKNKSIYFNKYWDPVDYYNKPKLDISFSSIILWHAQNKWLRLLSGSCDKSC